MREIRIDYTKCGNARYISHLDMNRVFVRAVRRADLPIWFTEGFHPHPYLKYAQSLPLGVESCCESVDIRLTDDNFSNAEVKGRLNAVLPEGIEVLRVHEPKMKPTEIYAAVYRICYEAENTAAITEKATSVLEGETLFVSKKVKHGRKKAEEDVDILPNVITYVLTNDGVHAELKLLATAQQNNTLNIFLFAGALEKAAGFDYRERRIYKDCVVNENYRYFK